MKTIVAITYGGFVLFMPAIRNQKTYINSPPNPAYTAKAFWKQLSIWVKMMKST